MVRVYRKPGFSSSSTARPGADDEARAPHRLYGVLSAAEACSAGRWRVLALAEIHGARGDGRLPILVGGTGLYFRALTDGLAPVPEVPAGVRRAARALHARLGAADFHAELARRDPEAAARFAPGDTQRSIRAWEVIEATGVSLVEWQRRHGADAGLAGPVLPLVLAPPRPALYAACDGRFLAMVERGAVAEVAALDSRGLAPDLPAMKAVGVRELRRHIRGELSLDEAVAAAQRATRNYAKRQLVWFRYQMTGARVYTAQYSDSLARRAVNETRRFVLTANR